jgi:hypothetical protein
MTEVKFHSTVQPIVLLTDELKGMKIQACHFDQTEDSVVITIPKEQWLKGSLVDLSVCLNCPNRKSEEESETEAFIVFQDYQEKIKKLS